MVNLTWKDKVRKVFGLGLTSETAMAIAREESSRRAAEAELDNIIRAAAESAKLKAEAELAAKTAKKLEEIKAAAKPQVAKTPAPKKATPAAPKKKAVAFDPNAVDGDGDGLVQDGTIHERPAPKKKATPAKKKPTK